jgi:hypothetical protein
MKIEISNNLRELGIPSGYKLISEEEYIQKGGVNWLKSLKDTTPVIKDLHGNTGSRIWWCYSTGPDTIRAININTLATRNCGGIPNSMMAILLPE